MLPGPAELVLILTILLIIILPILIVVGLLRWVIGRASSNN